MRVVYTLREELARDPSYVREVQAMSLNEDKPEMGLSARPGLFGSEGWWRKVESGAIPQRKYVGLIIRLYSAGMDSDRTKPNSFWMKTDEGADYSYSIMANDPSHKSLYTVGRRIEITTVLLELKRQAALLRPDYSEQPLEISIQRRAPKETHD